MIKDEEAFVTESNMATLNLVEAVKRSAEKNGMGIKGYTGMLKAITGALIYLVSDDDDKNEIENDLLRMMETDETVH